MSFTVVAMAAGLLAGIAPASPAQERPTTTMPVLVREVKPEYTKAALDRKVEGSVWLEVVVNADGTVADTVKVVKSLDRDLDRQAVTAAKQWRFRPGTKDGEPVPVTVSLELTFSLQRQAPVYTPGNGIVSPRATKQVNPRYTDAARRAGIHGTVELTGIVETDGRIGSIQVTKSLEPELDQEAVAALSQWQFTPGQKDGVNVRVKVNIEMTFTVR